MRRALALASLSLLAACSNDPPHVRSCRGERVLECDPHEYAIITGATFEPEGVAPSDPRVRPMITVDFEACGASTPGPVRIELQARVTGGAGDAGGDGVRVYDLGTIAMAAGTEARVEATIDNPLFVPIPEDEDIVLRFVPDVGSCEGQAFELDYHTGELVRP